MLKKFRKKLDNQGNTFIMVVVTLTFLAVLTTALLVAIALCYRLKAMDINSRDNFYYLEQAMDEIHAGVGADSIAKLSQAYENTLEVIVYYDTESKSYITMKPDQANKLMKKTYMKLVKTDENYQSADKVEARFKQFITYLYDASARPDGVVCTVENVDLSEKENDNLTILNLRLTRTADYSTLTVGKNGASDSFTQTISTDLVIGTPEFDVSFNPISASMNALFSFSMIADKGIEMTNAKINVAGDIYAASDFYNKDYNGSGTDVTNKNKAVTVTAALKNNPALNIDGAADKLAAMYTVPVSSYGISSTIGGTDTRFNSQDGTSETSMYSGLYMSNANVVITANKIIVPGSIAAMNTTDLTVSAVNGNMVGKTDIWADSIILGGYSLTHGKENLEGSNVSLNANCYVSDDLELNATGSKFALIGEYYGYNNSTTDNRSFSNRFLRRNGVFTHNWDSSKNAEQTGQAHYNSSAVIINGDGAALDLKDVSSMYIAGQSYIELSKKTKTDSEKMTYSYDGNSITEDVEKKTYSYTNNDSNGNFTDSDYTVSGSGRKHEAVQDYKTGEAVSIKSNQLAYIPPRNILSEKVDGETRYYVTLPDALLQESPFKETWPDPHAGVAKALEKIPVIKTVISGKEYAYFDFSTAARAADEDVNKFIAAYSKLFEDGSTSAAKAYLTDITDYEGFQVDMLKLPTAVNSSKTDYDKIYSNAALTVKSGNTFSIVADSSSTKALIQAASRINENEDKKGSDATKITGAESASGNVLSTTVTNRLRNQYKEMKLLLTNQSTDATSVEVAHTIGESAITPINHFFKFSVFDASGSVIKDVAVTNLEKSGYGLWINEGDIKIDSKSSSGQKALKGIVIAKGDVTFENNVSSFEGIIISGGKIRINQNMDFIANEEVVKSVLRICENHKDDSNKMYRQALTLFRSYGGDEDQDDIITDDNSEGTKTISTIQFEDILEFNNWKKNVD